MREIKFRIPHYNANGEFKIFTYWGRIEDRCFTSPSTVNRALYTKPDEQYTGLNDKNGNKIYEGDIVEIKDVNPTNHDIKFIEGGFCTCNPETGEWGADINIWYPSGGCMLKVVGNIHENPELLENK